MVMPGLAHPSLHIPFLLSLPIVDVGDSIASASLLGRLVIDPLIINHVSLRQHACVAIHLAARAHRRCVPIAWLHFTARLRACALLARPSARTLPLARPLWLRVRLPPVLVGCTLGAPRTLVGRLAFARAWHCVDALDTADRWKCRQEVGVVSVVSEERRRGYRSAVH